MTYALRVRGPKPLLFAQGNFCPEKRSLTTYRNPAVLPSGRSMAFADQRLAQLLELVAVTERHHFAVGMGAELRGLNSGRARTAKECAAFASAASACEVANANLVAYREHQSTVVP